MVNLTFWTCVKIGFGLTLGHWLCKNLTYILSEKGIEKLRKAILQNTELRFGVDSPEMKIAKKICNAKDITNNTKQPIGFCITNKND